MKEHEAVTKARSAGDIWVLVACLAVLGGVWFIVFVIGFLIALTASATGPEEGVIGFIFENLGYLLIGLFILGVTMVLTRIMRQNYLANSLEVEFSNYAWLREWSNIVAKDLQMPKVEIFITQDPVINAFALGFYGPYTIVLNSGSIRYLTKDELKAVVVHEMAHVKYHHTKINVYLSFISAYPLIGQISKYVLDFWGRRAELTSDRLALTYLKDASLVKNSLVKVHVGPDVAQDFNQIARDWQAHKTSGPFTWFSQTFSSHPFLVRRLQHVDQSTHLIETPNVATEPHAAT